MDEDLFDGLLNLEDTYYQDGYRLGVEDGSRAGRIEGRTFGLEKGYEKFFEMGKLHGKSQIWDARCGAEEPHKAEGVAPSRYGVKMLPKNERLGKHIRTLNALSELESLSTENNEDTVSEFDDRLKRAAAKAKVIETILSERASQQRTAEAANGTRRSGVKLPTATSSAEKNIEDFGIQIR